ncbi:FAD-dependent oxidoreductase [Actinopolyspora mortivallis]|uniref:FAD-dependent oxidoreductase n=1 Tax=Actinopolyspora mortivallis TaxID=33906 RepID=UPI0003802D35|nr:FAD-dependent oxidoreductase [Actinopolyspora mortivallis]
MSPSGRGHGTRKTSLNAARRDRELAELADGGHTDVLVVGGGLTGAAVALDAASRGLAVTLVEREDLAAESVRAAPEVTRDLPRRHTPGELGRARRRAGELATLTNRTAPHLVRPLPLLVPLAGDTPRGDRIALRARLHGAEALRLGAGVDTEAFPPSRRVPEPTARALVPALPPENVLGGLLCFVGRPLDEARLVVALARTAAGLGARILTRVRALETFRDGASVLDRLGERELRLRARAVVNATGSHAGRLTSGLPLRTRHSRHLLLSPEFPGLSETALAAPRGETEPWLELLPGWGGPAVLGPDEENDSPAPAERLLEACARVLGVRPGPGHVLGVRGQPRTVPDTRRTRSELGSDVAAAPHVSPDGVVTVLGADPLVVRATAESAVNTVVRTTGLRAGPCRTAHTPLVGAAARRRLALLEAPAELVARHGTEAERVVATGELDHRLAEPVVPGCSLTGSEVVWAVRHEGALEAADVLDRRAAPVDAALRQEALPAVEELVARALRGVRL